MRKRLIFIIILVIMVIGYFIGSYFTDFALKRVDPSDINSGPEAAESIRDKSFKLSDKPDAPNEVWTITSKDGLKLNATYFSPGSFSHNWVILVHGYGRDQRFAWDFAETYLAHGYNALTPDLRASGTSEGTYLTMGARESDDILLWMEKILEVDPNAEIVLHGVSMGAATVIMTAGKSRSPNLVAVVEDCGYTSAFNMFTAQLKVLFGLPSFPIMNFVDLVSHFKTGVAISDAAPIFYVKTIDVPILFIHGTEDKLVPYYMMQELYDHCHAPIKEIFSVEGAGHADAKFDNPVAYFNRIFTFLEQY